MLITQAFKTTVMLSEWILYSMNTTCTTMKSASSALLMTSTICWVLFLHGLNPLTIREIKYLWQICKRTYLHSNTHLTYNLLTVLRLGRTDAQHEIVEWLVVDVHECNLHGQRKVCKVSQVLPALCVRQLFLLSDEKQTGFVETQFFTWLHFSLYKQLFTVL